MDSLKCGVSRNGLLSEEFSLERPNALTPAEVHITALQNQKGIEWPNLQDVYKRYLACCNERRFSELAEFVHDPIRVGGEMTPLADYAKTIASNIDAVPAFTGSFRIL